MELEKIKEIMDGRVDADVDSITEETRFDSLGLDSLDITELLMEVDEAFGTEIEPSTSLATVGDLIALIKEQKA